MEITTTENTNSKEEQEKLILKEIDISFDFLKKAIPTELKEEIEILISQFSEITKGPQKEQYLEKLNILNSIVNQLSQKIKSFEGINEDSKKYLNKIKKFMYQLNSLENRPTSITKTYNNGKYKGDFINDKREGKGIYLYNNGDKYEGEYKNDLKDGYI